MSWTINDDEAPPEGFEVSDVPIWRVPGHQKFLEHGQLHPVPRDEIRNYNPNTVEFLPPHIRSLHERMVAKYGVGNIVAFTIIEADFPDVGKFPIRNWLRRLWAGGYLDKYARGVYMLTYQKNWQGRKNAWRGKYFGVHYQIMNKVYK